MYKINEGIDILLGSLIGNICKICAIFFQEYSVQITFRQQWNDNRLAFNDMNGKYKPVDQSCKCPTIIIHSSRVVLTRKFSQCMPLDL